MDDIFADPTNPARSMRDEASLLECARRLVRQGYVRRLWLLLIGPDGQLLPQLQQIDGTPISPDAYAVLGLRRILSIVAEPDVEVVAVLERSGSSTPAPDDLAWRAVLERAAAEQAVPLRAVLLAHGAGVDLLRPEVPRTLAA